MGVGQHVKRVPLKKVVKSPHQVHNRGGGEKVGGKCGEEKGSAEGENGLLRNLGCAGQRRSYSARWGWRKMWMNRKNLGEKRDAGEKLEERGI